MADDKQERIETLQDRVDELEATVSKMLPSRRDALKLGAAGAVGAVGMAGSASAQNSGQTGTIGTDADRVDVNAEDIDAVSVNTDQATIASKVGVGFPASSSDSNLSFDTYTQADPDRPALVVTRLKAVTDGSTRGLLTFDVDESGGTSLDYTITGSFADPRLGSGGEAEEATLLPLPAGAQFQLRNVDDPNASNEISSAREFIL